MASCGATDIQTQRLLTYTAPTATDTTTAAAETTATGELTTASVPAPGVAAGPDDDFCLSAAVGGQKCDKDHCRHANGQPRARVPSATPPSKRYVPVQNPNAAPAGFLAQRKSTADQIATHLRALIAAMEAGASGNAPRLTTAELTLLPQLKAWLASLSGSPAAE